MVSLIKGNGRRSAGHQYAGTSGRRTGPVSCGPDALPRPGTGAANCASPTGRFLFHVAPPAYRGLAFGPRCAAPAKYRPGTVGHIRLPRNTCSSLAFPQRWFSTSRWLDVLVGRFSASGRNGISHAGTLEQL